jgi:hypothetical protein
VGDEADIKSFSGGGSELETKNYFLVFLAVTAFFLGAPFLAVSFFATSLAGFFGASCFLAFALTAFVLTALVILASDGFLELAGFDFVNALVATFRAFFDIFAHAFAPSTFVGIEVTFAPIKFAIAFEREDMRREAVEEPAVVAEVTTTHSRRSS